MIIMLTILDNRTHETCNAFFFRGTPKRLREIEIERASERDIGGDGERECASSERDLWVQFISITFHSLGLYFVVVCFCCIWFFVFVVVVFWFFFCSKITKEKETSNIAFKAALCTYFFVLTDLTF